MIRVKTIVEITDEFNREDLDLDFQKMSLKDLQNYCLSNKKADFSAFCFITRVLLEASLQELLHLSFLYLIYRK